MTTTDLNANPKSGWGWGGLRSHWRNDLIAASSVSLVALPLALGLAVAGGAPPVAGLISVVVASLVATFIRGSHVAINGPANSFVVVSLAAQEHLSEEGESGFAYAMAAFVVAGGLQILLGLFRFGKLGNVVPSAVIQGMLAAIGFIILGTQIHLALGIEATAQKTLGILAEIPKDILHLNPFITLISITGLLILIYYPRVSSKIERIIPAPIWVLVSAISLFFLFRFFTQNTSFEHLLASKHLIQIPDDLTAGLSYPDFSKIDEPIFWLIVLMITLVFSLESLVSAKAIDRLDPYKRTTNLDKELIGIGLASIVSSMIGGLPVSTVIARSSVNINNAAKTRWSNFFHGLILLIFVVCFSSFIQIIPLAALAAILIFTGYKLTSPKVFSDIYQKGWEQLAICVVTLIVTLAAGLIAGLCCGILFTLWIQYVRSKMPLGLFIRYLKHPFVKIVQEKKSTYLFKLKGVVNFINILSIQKKIKGISPDKNIIMDFSHTRLVDHTVLEYVHEYAEQYNRNGGEFHFTGLDIHKTSSHHPYALHVMESPEPTKIRLTRRQVELKQLAQSKGWIYQPDIDWDVSDMDRFLFFKTRPVEFKKNQIAGQNEKLDVPWKLFDISLKNAFIAFEKYSLTVEILKLPFEIPVFSLEEEGFLDRMSMLAEQKDIDIEEFENFSRKFLLIGPDEKAIRKFFNSTLIRFFEQGDIYHLESTGKELLMFRHLRLTSPKEILKMVQYSERLLEKLQEAVLEVSK